MKKSAIWILVTITLVFGGFVAGFYLGRNENHGPVQVESKPFTSSSTVAAPIVTPSSQGKVNINTATYEEFLTLPDIGPVLARSIVDYRYENGYFSCIDDLTKVDGIGPKTLEKLKDYITV